MDPRKRLQVLQQQSPSIRTAVAPRQTITVNTGKRSVDIEQDPNLQTNVRDNNPGLSKPQAISAGVARGVSQSLHDATDVLPQTIGQLKAVTPHPFDNIADAARGFAQKASDAAFGYNNMDKLLKNNGYDVNEHGDLTDPLAHNIATGARVGGNVAQAVAAAPALIESARNIPTFIGNVRNVATGLRTAGLAGAKEAASVNKSVKVANQVGVDANLLHSLRGDNDVSSVLGKLIDAGMGNGGDAVDLANKIAGTKSAREIAHAISDLPVEAAGAVSLAAAASDGIAREKYGVSPLTGERAPILERPAPPVDNGVDPGDLNFQQPGGIQLQSTKYEDMAKEAEDVLGIADDTTRQSPLNQNAKEIVKDPKHANLVATSADAGKSNSLDTVTNMIANSSKKGEVRDLLTKMFHSESKGGSALEGNDLNRAVKDLHKETDPAAVKQRLAQEVNKIEGSLPEGAKPGEVPAPSAPVTTEEQVAKGTADTQSGVAEPKPTAAAPTDTNVAEQVNKNADAAAAPETTDHPTSPEIDAKTIRYSDAETGKTKVASVAELRDDIKNFKEKHGTEDLTAKQQRRLEELERNYHIATFDAEKQMVGATPEEKASVQKIVDGLSENLKNYDSAKKLRAKERAIKFAKGTSANQDVGGGMEGYKAKLGSMRGKLSAPKFNSVNVDPATRDGVLDLIESNGKSRGWQDGKRLNTQTAMLKVLGEVDGAPTPSEIRNIREFFGDDVANTIQEAVDKHPKDWKSIVSGVAGLPKSLMSTFDFSAPRQAGQLAAAHPITFVKRYAESMRAAFSPEFYEKNYVQKLSKDPYHDLITEDMGVDIPGVSTGQEEKFANANIAEKIPGYGKTVVKGSERAFSYLLGTLRHDVAAKVIDNAGGEEGYRSMMAANYGDKAKEATRVWGETINTLSGRGGAKGGVLEKHMATAGATLFSPRLWASKVQQLNPVWYAKLAKDNPKAAAEAVKAQAAFYTMVGSTLYLASRAPGVDVGTDMRSADFGKIKVGNTRFDIMGGQQQNMVQLWRQVTGEKVNSETGAVTKLGEGFGTTNRFDLFVDMLVSKSNPLINTAIGIAKSHHQEGDPWYQNVDQYGDKMNLPGKIASLVVPLNASGVVSTYKDTGSIPKALAFNAPGVVGVGVNTYGSTKTKDMQNVSDVQKEGAIPNGAKLAEKGKGLMDANGKPIFFKDKNGKYKQAEKPADAKDGLANKINSDKVVRESLGKAFDSKLGAQDKTLTKTSSADLKSYLDKGTITQQQYDHALKLHESRSDYIKTKSGLPDPLPEGVKPGTPEADFYNKYNTLVSKDQKEFTKHGNSDPTAKAVVDELNNNPDNPTSVPKLGKANNQLAKLYADYKIDVEKNKNNDTDIDRQNKAKSFWNKAIRTQYDSVAQDLVSEGNSHDYKALVKEGKITKGQLDQAIQLDNALYQTGWNSMKFGKKFREAHGYPIPTKTADGKDTLSSGSGDGTGKKRSKAADNAYLSALLPGGSGGSGGGGKAPTFSSRSRGIKFKGSGTDYSGKASRKISINL